MQIPGGFDPRQHAPATGEGGNLPVSGKDGHLVVITDSEVRETSDKSGWMLALSLEVVEGPMMGASGVDRLNLGNKSAETVKIALSQLSAICHCVGWLQPITDTTCLHGKPFRVIVVPQTGDGAAKGYTTIKGYRDRNGNKPGQVSAPTAAPAPAAAPAGFPTAPTAAPAPQVPVVQSNVPMPPQAPPAAPQQQAAPWAPPQAQPPQQQVPAPWAQPAAQAPQSNAGAPPWAQ